MRTGTALRVIPDSVSTAKYEFSIGVPVATSDRCVMRNILRSATIGVIFARENTSHVLFSDSKLCWQRSSGRGGRRHIDEGEAQARIAFRGAARAIRHSSVHRGIRLAGIGRNSLAHG